MTVGQLLTLYADILTELRRRGLVRTKNAPLGDLAEYAAALAYGGLLAKNSEKSYDLTAADGRRIQVKARSVDRNASPSQTFSPIRTLGFDVTVFIIVDADTNSVKSAFEWSPTEVGTLGRWSEHTKGHVVRIGQIRAAGTDVTEMMQGAWAQLLDLVETVEPD
ncbi:DUF6998 domain-containing protein [Agromyces albus]|uniref:DUF6998 domain-containing protein n=1 Tax=Agromyces albus TaxID=205332 RepID=A0A4Q2L3N8_9MICO|nr:hypothetical protein [Agromyces albus]RXZ72785.1 hypothetical protein ESP51_03015 [Agromyces albus]